MRTIDRKNISVGQKVYLAPGVNKVGMGSAPVVEGTIKTVGRKYYTVTVDGGVHEYRFDKDDLRQVTDYTPDYELYFDRQKLLDDKESEKLRVELSRFFGSPTGRSTDLSVDTLRCIDTISKTNTPIVVMEWIDVQQRLPDNELPVLLYTRSGRRLIGGYLADVRKWFDYEAHKRGENQLTPFRYDPIKFWMPLPEPPSEERETDDCDD